MSLITEKNINDHNKALVRHKKLFSYAFEMDKKLNKIYYADKFSIFLLGSHDRAGHNSSVKILIDDVKGLIYKSFRKIVAEDNINNYKLYSVDNAKHLGYMIFYCRHDNNMELNYMLQNNMIQIYIDNMRLKEWKDCISILSSYEIIDESLKYIIKLELFYLKDGMELYEMRYEMDIKYNINPTVNYRQHYKYSIDPRKDKIIVCNPMSYQDKEEFSSEKVIERTNNCAKKPIKQAIYDKLLSVFITPIDFDINKIKEIMRILDRIEYNKNQIGMHFD